MFDIITKNGSFLEQGDYKGITTPVESVWLDISKLPSTIPSESDFKEGKFYTQVNGRDFCILERVEKVQLDQISDFVFTHSLMRGVLTPWFNSTHYPIQLEDSNGVEIPLGYVKAQVDPLGGKLVVEKEIENFTKPLFVSFYRYTGRTNLDGLIDTQGLVSMDPTYQPLNDQDVATKKFVEESIKEINNTVFDLVPKKPATLEKQPLKVVDSLGVFELTTSGKEYPVFNSKKALTLKLENFYLPLKGVLRIFVSGVQVVEFSVERSNFDSTKTFTISDFGSIKYKDLKEYKEWVPSGYFDVADLEIVLNTSNLAKFFKPDTPVYEVKVQYYYKENGDEEKYESNNVEVGYEPDLQYTKTPIDLELSKGGYKKVSGVVSLKDGEKLRFFFDFSPLQYFKKKDSVLAVLKVFDKEVQVLAQEVYSLVKPLLTIENCIEVEQQGNFETIPIEYKTYNFTGEILDQKKLTLNLRYDSTSETERVDFDPTQNIWGTKDLQKLNGRFVYPQKDFSKNGQDIDQMLNAQGNTFPISANFTDSPNQDSSRYVEFSDNLPLVHGFAVQLLEPTGFQSDSISEIPLNFEIEVKIKDKTGWLSCKPYLLGTDPCKDNDRALVPQFSSGELKRFTFGRKSYSGELRVRIGWIDKSLSFAGIKVFPLE